MEIGRQPRVRVGQIVRRGVNPIPPHDLKAWRKGNGHVLVLHIRPVSVPPAITSQGQVYERVVGESVPVQEPLRLAELFEAGTKARSAAEANAVNAARVVAFRASSEPEFLRVDSHEDVRFGIAICATAYSPDIASRLFRPEFRDLLVHATGAIALVDPRTPSPLRPVLEEFVRQEAAFLVGTAANVVANRRSALAVGGFWNGAVAAGWTIPGTETALTSLIEGKVVPAWSSLMDLVQQLGGSGPAYLALAVPGTPKLYDGPGVLGELTMVKRAVDLRPPEQPEVDSITRELKRAGGLRADEPAP